MENDGRGIWTEGESQRHSAMSLVCSFETASNNLIGAAEGKESKGSDSCWSGFRENQKIVKIRRLGTLLEFDVNAGDVT